MKSDFKKLPPVAITFDIDWAPDWAVDECLHLCERYGIPATFFVTHSSKIIQDFSNDAKIELGIHPNFLPGSSHGESPEDVLKFCRNLLPNARSMRSHGLMHWTGLYDLVANVFPSIEIDVSLYLHKHEGLRPVHMPIVGGGGNDTITLFLGG